MSTTDVTRILPAHGLVSEGICSRILKSQMYKVRLDNASLAVMPIYGAKCLVHLAERG
jgi:hypothetical protein